jgi:hypothetical protein
LVAGGLPSERVTVLVKQRGIDFLAEEDYLDTLRLAGADDTLIAAVREASTAATAALAVDTSPSAEVFLDSESQGHHKDVKNEGRPGYVLENTFEVDKMADDQTRFLAENAQIARNPNDFLSGNARIAHKSTRTRNGQRVSCATRTGRRVGRSRNMPHPYVGAFRRSANLQNLSRARRRIGSVAPTFRSARAELKFSATNIAARHDIIENTGETHGPHDPKSSR